MFFAAALVFYCMFPGVAKAAYFVVNVDGWDITRPEVEISMGEAYLPDRVDNVLTNELIIKNSSLYMPVRKAADIFHLQVDYAGGMVKVSGGDKTLSISVGYESPAAYGDRAVPLFIQDGQAYVSLRTVTEMFGGKVEYIPQAKIVNIITSEPLQVEGKKLCYATFYNTFGMQSRLYGYYGYANVADLYRILQAGRGAEIEEPRWGSYNCDWEIQFYEEPPVYAVGDLRNASGYFLKYNLCTIFGAAGDRFALYDENEDKWYEYAHDPLDFRDSCRSMVLLTCGGA